MDTNYVIDILEDSPILFGEGKDFDAQNIKKVLETFGGKNTKGWTFDSLSYYYCIRKDYTIDCIGLFNIPKEMTSNVISVSELLKF